MDALRALRAQRFSFRLSFPRPLRTSNDRFMISGERRVKSNGWRRPNGLSHSGAEETAHPAWPKPDWAGPVCFCAALDDRIFTQLL